MLMCFSYFKKPPKPGKREGRRGYTKVGPKFILHMFTKGSINLYHCFAAGICLFEGGRVQIVWSYLCFPATLGRYPWGFEGNSQGSQGRDPEDRGSPAWGSTFAEACLGIPGVPSFVEVHSHYYPTELIPCHSQEHQGPDHAVQ